MPPHIVSMDSNSLMNPYRDADLWQRSAIIPGHVLHPPLVRVNRAAALRFGTQRAAPLPWPGKREKSLVPNVLENQEFGPKSKKPTFPSSEFLSPQSGSGSNSEMSLGAPTWRRKLEGIRFISAIVIA